MAYPNILSASSMGRSASTSYAATPPSVSAAGANGLLIAIVSTRVNAAISCATSGWFKVGEIRRTTGSLGTTAIFGVWTTGSQPSTPTFTSTSSLWWLSWLVIDNADSIGPSSSFTLGDAASTNPQATGSIALPSFPAESLYIGVFADSRTTSLTASTTNSTEVVSSFNATYDVWHWAGWEKRSGGNASVQIVTSASASVREAIFSITGTTNTAPTITAQPTFSTGRTYDIGTGTGLPYLGAGSSNGGTISFNATDTQQTGTNALTYAIRTSATVGGGTSVTSGYMTSGSAVNKEVTNSNGGLNSSGDKTLYVQVSDGFLTTVSNPLSVTVDTASPLTSYTVTVEPDPVLDFNRYRLRFTPTDTTSTGTNQLRYEVRTATNGAGTQLVNGSATSGVEVVTPYFVDTALAQGTNTRYIRIQDAGGNISQKTITFTSDMSQPWDFASTPQVGSDDGYFSLTSTAFSATAVVAIAGWTSSTVNQAMWLRFPSDSSASPTYTTNYAMIYFSHQSTGYTPPNIKIYGVKQLNPESPTSATIGQTLPLTDTYIEWSPPVGLITGQPYATPNLAAVVDEIKSQPGWTPGNYFMFILKTDDPYVASTQIRIETFENTAGINSTFYMDWNPVAIINEESVEPTLIYLRAFSSIEQRLIDAVGGEHVILNAVTSGTIDGRVLFDTSSSETFPVWVSGVDLLIQTDLTTEAIVAAVALSGQDVLGQSDTAGMVLLRAVTTGLDVGHYNEFEDTVEAILEASSTLEDFDMYDLLMVEIIEVYTRGFDLLSGAVDDSNPVTIYVETMGEDAFELGPQVYDEETIEIVVVMHPQLGGGDTSTMHDLLVTDLYHAATSSSIEFYQGRYEEFNNPVVARAVESGIDTMVMNASIGEVFSLPVVSQSSIDEHHMFEPTGEIVSMSITTASVEDYSYDETKGIVLVRSITLGQEFTIFFETEGETIIDVLTLGNEGLQIDATDGMVVVDMVTFGYEGNLIEEFTSSILIQVITDSTEEEYRVRVPHRYLRSSLVVEHPYSASTLEVVNPYTRSSLVSIHQMRESILAAT